MARERNFAVLFLNILVSLSSTARIFDSCDKKLGNGGSYSRLLWRIDRATAKESNPSSHNSGSVVFSESRSARSILSLRGGATNNNEDEDSPEEQLLWAARTGEIADIEQILDAGRVDVNWGHPDTGNTALHMASANGHTACIDLLLRAGANPDLANARGNTALHWAAENKRAAAVQRLLEEGGADVLRRNGFGKSALTLAFQAGEEDIVAAVRPPCREQHGRALETVPVGAVAALLLISFQVFF